MYSIISVPPIIWRLITAIYIAIRPKAMASGIVTKHVSRLEEQCNCYRFQLRYTIAVVDFYDLIPTIHSCCTHPIYIRLMEEARTLVKHSNIWQVTGCNLQCGILTK